MIEGRKYKSRDPVSFVTGKPCPFGHTDRYSKTGNCVQCNRVAAQKRRDRIKAEGADDKPSYKKTAPKPTQSLANFLRGKPL